MSDIDLHELYLCFEGAVPAVVATASGSGTPNITYLSRVRLVDRERVALSNQFFSKTVRNLSENPRASVLVIDPCTYSQYRLSLEYERTERRGPTFDRLRDDVDTVAVLHHMQDVFNLRAADIYRVVAIESTMPLGAPLPEAAFNRGPSGIGPDTISGMAELSARIARCGDLDTLVAVTVDGLAELLHYDHTLLMLADEENRHLYTIASHGYDAEGVGSEVVVGEGTVGVAALRCAPQRVGNLLQMRKYARRVAISFDEREIPMPSFEEVQSRIAVPMMAMGHLVGVLVAESSQPVAFDGNDEQVLGTIASAVAGAIETTRSTAATSRESAAAPGSDVDAGAARATTHVRFFPVDGSTFLDGDYLIKGVAGRILWSLLNQYSSEGRVEFTNREVRLDPSLELPEYRDNLESRLILLKRRLAERDAPISLSKTGRGRFRIDVDDALRLESVDDRAVGQGAELTAEVERP